MAYHLCAEDVLNVGSNSDTTVETCVTVDDKVLVVVG
jgi:hypothetical protein